MSTILITGGCGFVGSHLARFLVQHDYNVILVDSVVNERLISDIKRKIIVVEGDITIKSQLRKILKKHKVDAIVHYASLLSASTESNPNLGYKINFEGIWNVYNSAMEYEVNSLIYASSVAAYGTNVSTEVKENMYTIPRTLYGISKQFGEMAGLWFYRKYGLQFVAFRYASIIGPGRRDGGASAYSTLIIQKPAQGERYEVIVEKDASIPIVYIKDAVEVTKIAYEKIRKLRSRIYNISSVSSSPPAGEIANKVKEYIPDAEIIFKPNPEIVKVVKSWPRNLDTTKVRNELGWSPKYSNLDMIISDFTNEVKKYPEIFRI